MIFQWRKLVQSTMTVTTGDNFSKIARVLTFLDLKQNVWFDLEVFTHWKLDKNPAVPNLFKPLIAFAGPQPTRNSFFLCCSPTIYCNIPLCTLWHNCYTLWYNCYTLWHNRYTHCDTSATHCDISTTKCDITVTHWVINRYILWHNCYILWRNRYTRTLWHKCYTLWYNCYTLT